MGLSKKISDLGEIKAFFGSGAEFEGLLSFDGTVRIDGLFRGEIQTNDCLVIGKTGQVDAEIQVGHLIIMGKLNGNVKATGKVEVASTGHIKGDLVTSVLVIQEGATIEGNIHMDKSLNDTAKTDKKVYDIKQSGKTSAKVS